MQFNPGALRLARLNRHLTREQVSVLLGRSLRTILRWETGSIVPHADVVARLATVYRCDIEDFFVDDGDPDGLDEQTNSLLALLTGAA